MLTFLTLSQGVYADGDQGILRLGTQYLPPYQTLENNGIAGTAVTRIRCALDKVGVDYEIIMMDWSEAQIMTKSGDLDGFFVGTPNPERETYSTASAPIIIDQLAWFTLKESNIDPRQDDVKKKARYSAEFSTSKWQYLYKNGFNMVRRPRNVEILLDMLLTGGIDVAYENVMIFETYANRQNMSISDFNVFPLEKKENVVFFSNSYLRIRPVFLQQFNDAVSTCGDT